MSHESCYACWLFLNTIGTINSFSNSRSGFPQYAIDATFPKFRYDFSMFLKSRYDFFHISKSRAGFRVGRCQLILPLSACSHILGTERAPEGFDWSDCRAQLVSCMPWTERRLGLTRIIHVTHSGTSCRRATATVGRIFLQCGRVVLLFLKVFLL